MANIQSGVGSDLLTIDPTSKAARATLYDTLGNSLLVKNGVDKPSAGLSGLVIAGENDGASRIFRSDRLGCMRPGFDTLLFRDSAETGAVSGTPIAPNLNQWVTAVSGFAVGLPTINGNQLTATTVTTAAAYSIATSQRHFQKLQKVPLFYRRRGRNVQVANTVSEFGFGLPTTNTAIIPNSAHWRFGSNGIVVPVLTYNNTEIIGNDISGSLTNTNYYTWEVIVDDDSVLFICQDVTTGQSISEQTLYIGSTSPKIWSVTRLPIFERVFNSGTPASAPTILFSDIYVCSIDLVNNKTIQQQLAAATQGGAESYPGAFVAANAQTTNWTNSTVPGTATLSNTAAGYTTLGGKFLFAAVASAETDFALFAFTVPAGFTFNLESIDISLMNTGAAVATTPSTMEWFVANNSSAVSLATVGLSRTPIGITTLPVATPIGGAATPINIDFKTPLVTHGSRILHIGFRMTTGTATASQLIRGNVSVRGFFE